MDKEAQEVSQKKLSDFLDTSEKKSYFVIAVTALFTILLLGFGVLPSFSAVTLQITQNNKRAETIEQIVRKKMDLTLLSKEADESQNIIATLNEAFPTKLSQDKIFELILQLAERNSMTFQSINFSQSTESERLFSKFQVDDKVRTLSLNLILRSSDTKFINFLRDIEDLKQVFIVNSVIVTRVPDQDTGSYYQINLLIDYFYYLD